MERAHGRTTCIALLGVWVLSACAAQPPHPDSTSIYRNGASRPSASAPVGLVQLLRYADRIRALPLSTLQHEFAEAEQQFVMAPTPDNRMRLALLLSLPTAPFRNDARARDLLTSATGYPELVRWVLITLDERRALEEIAEEERRRRVALQAKLNQLKAIEADMDRRMPPMVNPR